jgi:hypothetical protein
LANFVGDNSKKMKHENRNEIRNGFLCEKFMQNLSMVSQKLRKSENLMPI